MKPRFEVEVDDALNDLSERFLDDYGRQLNAGSVRGLRLFLLAHGWADIPGLSAESSGLVIATWRMDGRSASVEFLNDDIFHYALALETSEGRSRPYGTTSRLEFLVERPEARAILSKALGRSK